MRNKNQYINTAQKVKVFKGTFLAGAISFISTVALANDSESQQSYLSQEKTVSSSEGSSKSKSTAESEIPSTDKPNSGDARVMVVTGSRHSKDKALINSYASVEEAMVAPNTVTELLEHQSGLAANGQPGLFQTLSIRGLARQRVQVYVNGMRITSERRAGVAASFVDPLLLAGAEVTQGPASTHYGSGAIGGTVHLVTRQDTGLLFNTGYLSDGAESALAVTAGGEQYSTGIAWRERNNGRTIDGEPKNNHFSQLSVNFLKQFELADYKLDWQLIYSSGDELGKDNARFPDARITSYPQEQHFLSQVTLSSETDWQAKLYFHQQDLITEDIRPLTLVNEVTTDSLDIGFSFEQQWQTENLYGLIGFDYFGRRDVNSLELETDLSTLQVERLQALANGSENESAVFSTIHYGFEHWSLSGGVRLNYQSQDSQNTASVSDEYITYFTTVTKSFDLVDLSISYGTGFRFASLSERLFNGTTGRGQTIGRVDLSPEESASIDLGMKYQQAGWLIDMHYFETHIDQFIERISLDSNTKTYANIDSGEINGWQYQVAYKVDSQLSIGLSGQISKGTDEQNNALADIPADRHRFTLQYDQGNWFSRLAYTYRLAKNDFADGERPLESANIIGLRSGFHWQNKWSIDVTISNLLDETYFNSADDLGTLATGRAFGVNFSYRQ